MPTIVACFKWVVDEAYIRRGPAGALDFSSVDYKISDYDRNAIEEAVRQKDVLGGSVIAVTVGVPEATKGVKDALSRGADQAFFINDASFSQLEPSQTADILAGVISGRIPCDLIICGEGSSDLYAQQVGPRLAELMGMPCISYVQKLNVDGGKLTAERRVEDGIETVTASLPALVTVLPDINTPRIPGVKDTLMASKKPVVSVGKGEISAGQTAILRTTGMTGAGTAREGVKFGSDDAEITRFIDALRKKGVLG